MFQVIPLAIFALASFTTAAPITAPNGVVPITKATMPASLDLPLNWKRDQQSSNGINKLVESAIIQVLSQQNSLTKRQNEVPFELETMFRGLFDKVVSYVIQVTPLHEIVEGNYDILYGFLSEKISEAIAGFGQAPPQAAGEDGASSPAPAAPFDLFGGTLPAIPSPFDLFGQSENEAPPAFPDVFNLGGSKAGDKSNKSDKNDEDNECDEEDDNEDDEDDEDENDNDENEEEDDDNEDDENDEEDDECDEDEDEEEDYEDYKKKWKNHWKKHHKSHHGK